MSGKKILAGFLGCSILWLLVTSCQTSAHLRTEYVDYEFVKEGFLAPDLIQVVARAAYRPARSLLNAQTLCLNDAGRAARGRMLRIFLNTALDIEEGISLATAATLESDYPAEFSLSDYIEAEIHFDEMLNRSYIALQDLRSPEECMLVMRLKGKDLAQEIRSHRSQIQWLKKPLAKPPRTNEKP